MTVMTYKRGMTIIEQDMVAYSYRDGAFVILHPGGGRFSGGNAAMPPLSRRTWE
jgi:hypothetical protein